MGKHTRAGFLVAAAALVLSALGCSGGAPPDSKYQNTYRSVYTIPDDGESGSFNFSVAKKGEMTGAFVSGDKTLAFSGSVNNSGGFSGKITDYKDPANPADDQVFNVAGTLTATGGDFEQVRGTRKVRGSFTVGGTLTTSTSDYRGIYSGVYNIPGLQSGLNSFTVDGKGAITGSITRGTETGALVGSVANSGSFTATATFSNSALPLVGTLAKTADGSAQGNFFATSAGKSYPGTFSKSETVQAGGDSPYKGSYRGTYGVPEQGENGTISFTVDPSGTITGFFSQTNNKPVGTFTGAFNNDGTFNGSLTYNAGEVSALPAAQQPLYQSRAIIGKLANSTIGNSAGSGGSFLSGDFIVTINGVNRAGNFEATVGGSEVNSEFRGTYVEPNIIDGIELPQSTGSSLDNLQSRASAYPPVYAPVTTLSLSIDKQGSILGTMGGLKFEGRITNDGRVVGTWNGFVVRGVISHQQLKVIDKVDVDNQGKVTITFVDKAGFAGNLYITVSGAEYAATIAGIGGSAGG